ncbi:hypothetical protein P4154_30480 [Pseudomonas aeruginosa]|nr:hypothetical protein [Pseudomonas aeruginosa]
MLIELGVGLGRQPFMQQRQGQARLAGPLRGADQGLREQITLRMGAAEGDHAVAQLGQQLDRLAVVTAGKGIQAARQRQRGVAGGAGIVIVTGGGFRHHRQQLIGQVEAPTGDKTEHRVQVIEAIPAVLDMGLPEGQLRLPAFAHIHALQAQAPEQRGGILMILNGQRVTANMLVVQRQHLGPGLGIEVTERQVPPMVHGQAIALGPVALALRQPVNALLRPSTHLQRLGHGMNGPCITRAGLQCLAAETLGTGMGTIGLQAEGIHAQVMAVERRAGVDKAQTAGHPVA